MALFKQIHIHLVCNVIFFLNKHFNFLIANLSEDQYYYELT